MAAILGLLLPTVHSCTPPAGNESCSLALVPAALNGPSLILSPARLDLAEAARLLGYFHACGSAQDRRAGLSVLRS